MSKWHDLEGEQKFQLLITTDKNGHKLGTATREKCHTNGGIPHLAFLAFLFNDKGEIYLQKRSNSKSLWDGYWDASVVSHVLPGESVEQAARRRGKEELGVDASFKDLGGFYYFAKYDGNCENEFCHVLIGKTNKNIIHNPVEISEVRLINLENVIMELGNSSLHFTPWLKIALEKFSDNILP